MGRMPIHRAMVPRPSDALIAPPIVGEHQPTLTRWAVADHLLVVATVVTVLGLGALMASLAPFASDCGDVVRLRPPMVIDRGLAPSPDPSRDGPVWSPFGEDTPAALLRDSRGSPWNELLQPSTIATIEAGLADVGTTASPRDPRVFLIDAAIQIHAPASAPAPRRRSEPPHPHGVD
jgi:hypothetical protein